MPLPSGRQVTLTHGNKELVVVEIGGGIRTYRAGDEAVIDGYRKGEMCSSGRGQLLAPWPNRLNGGAFEWEGRRLQTALTEPDHGNAIHGLVRWAAWTVVSESSDRARLEFRLHPQPGWPWIVDFAVEYSLSEDGLTVRTTVSNPVGGTGQFPFGVGWHPYLSAFGRPVDAAYLTIPADIVYRADERGIPVGSDPVDAAGFDFRQPRALGDLRLDHAFGELRRGAGGRAEVVLALDEAARKAHRLWVDQAYTHLMVYSGDTLPFESRRRRALAVEPMTCAPDMLNSGDGQRLLAVGETFEAVWGLELVAE